MRETQGFREFQFRKLDQLHKFKFKRTILYFKGSVREK